MSYRDTRNCIEMLRALGYPRHVSMESFRTPNFGLVASLLLWLARRFEPDAEIDGDTGTEEERVAFVRNVAQFMALKANIKLNTKRMYQADGYAVREILKVTSLLYEAMVAHHRGGGGAENKSNPDADVEFSVRDFDIADKLHDLKQSRQLATEITTSGASLFDMLGKEIDLRSVRETSVARQYEVSDVDTGIRKAIETIRGEIDETRVQIDNVAANEASLDGKIERRKVEIERYEKRLQTLKKVRPAFLDEFNILEAELNGLFDKYSTRVRCLAQLEKLAADAERSQMQRAQLASSQRPITTTIPLEDGDDDELAIEEPMAQNAKMIHDRKAPMVQAPGSRQERPRARTGGRTRQEGGVQPPPPPPGGPQTMAKTLAGNIALVYGAMDPGLSPSNSSLDITSESDDEDDDDDDDELFLDKDEPELVDVQSDDDSIGLEFSGMDTNKGAPSGRMTSSKLPLQDNSDDDF